MRTLRLALLSVILLSGIAQAAESGPGPDSVSSLDHARGNAKATITLIEYVDFECPFCLKHHKTMQAIANTYDVRWVYRPFPLSFHNKAMTAATAAECVADQKGERGFWRFHDLVFSRLAPKNLLDEGSLKLLAKSLGVNLKAYDDCMASERFITQINDVIKKAYTAQVSGTPTTFIVKNSTGETQKLVGAVTLATMKAAVEKMLK